mgnify:CR=1 FL=1
MAVEAGRISRRLLRRRTVQGRQHSGRTAVARVAVPTPDRRRRARRFATISQPDEKVCSRRSGVAIGCSSRVVLELPDLAALRQVLTTSTKAHWPDRNSLAMVATVSFMTTALTVQQAVGMMTTALARLLRRE